MLSKELLELSAGYCKFQAQSRGESELRAWIGSEESQCYYVKVCSRATIVVGRSLSEFDRFDMSLCHSFYFSLGVPVSPFAAKPSQRFYRNVRDIKR